MRTDLLTGGLIACCMFSSALSAQDTSQEVVAAPHSEIVWSAAPDVLPESVAPEPEPEPSSGPQGGANTPGAPRGKPAGGTPGGVTPYVFPSSSEINRKWLLNIVGPKAFVSAPFTASWNTWVINSPSEWGRDASGWTRRFGSSLLDNGINTSTNVLLSRISGQDPTYHRCDCSDGWGRTRHAIGLTFMSYTRSGSLAFSPAKVASPFAGPLVTRNTIYPDRYGMSNVASAGAYYFAGAVAWNLIREFIWKAP
ncbi:MAG TPA: hypothetical protein VFY29_19045 [Terriglobia bacterium]|nr:hypothetical protein [Terriglobia bacterium]